MNKAPLFMFVSKVHFFYFCGFGVWYRALHSWFPGAVYGISRIVSHDDGCDPGNGPALLFSPWKRGLTEIDAGGGL